MKPLALLFSLLVMIGMSGAIHGDPDPNSRNGIGFRGSYWNLGSRGPLLQVYQDAHFSVVDVGGYGGSLYFLSRMQDQLQLEFTLGAIAAVEEHRKQWHGKKVDAAAVVPILFGLRLDLLPLRNRESALRPYLSGGTGMYWLHDILIRDAGFYEEEVLVESYVHPGTYAGGGVDVNLGRHLSLNYDIKYHWVDFNSDRLESGFEFGIGFSIRWGKYHHH